jgi:hypothetical protein
MLVYAACTGAFFSLFWKETRSERLRMFLVIFCALFFGGIALGWAMYPFPQR